MNLWLFADRHPVWAFFYLLAAGVTLGWCADRFADACRWWRR